MFFFYCIILLLPSTTKLCLNLFLRNGKRSIIDWERSTLNWQSRPESQGRIFWEILLDIVSGAARPSKATRRTTFQMVCDLTFQIFSISQKESKKIIDASSFLFWYFLFSGSTRPAEVNRQTLIWWKLLLMHWHCTALNMSCIKWAFFW